MKKLEEAHQVSQWGATNGVKSSNQQVSDVVMSFLLKRAEWVELIDVKSFCMFGGRIIGETRTRALTLTYRLVVICMCSGGS